MKYKIAICDDEVDFVALLQNQVAEILRSNGVVFTTASRQYVFAGYEVQALQYLLKPVNWN